MKKIITIALTILSLVSCTNLDEVWAELRDHEERIQKLEALCNKLNSNIEAIQTILTALEQNDYVTDIVKVMEDGVEVGYSITFAKGGTVTIYHGTNGADGAAPQISIKKAQDGEYYWTADGEWMTDENGEKIPAVVADDPDGEYITPLFRVADGKWYVSVDNGNSWLEIGNISEDGNCRFFQSVTYNNDYLTLILSDGTEVKVPVGTESRIVDLFIFMGQSNMAGCGNAAEAPRVPEGWGYEYKAISEPGKLLHMVEPFGLNEDNPASGVVYSRRGSLVSAFTNAYYELTQTPVVGVSCSKGSTSTEFWMPGGAPLNDAIQRHRSAEKWLVENGYKIRNNFMVWLQGERDASTGVTPEEYSSNLKSILRTMINHTGVEKCALIRIGKFVGSPTICDTIIQAQTELCQTYKEFILGSALAAGFVEDNLMRDTWHYTQEGYNILGEDVGINLAFYVNNHIEPYMYDPHTGSTYFPVQKYKSIFDEKGNEAEENGGATYEFPLELEYEVLVPNRRVTGYLTDCVTGIQEASADDYYYEYDIDPSWTLCATGYAPSAHASNAAITYIDASGQVAGFEDIDFVAYNYRNLPLNIPADAVKVQIASKAAAGKMVPVLKRAVNYIGTSTKIDYDTALDEDGVTTTYRKGWAVAYDVPVEGGREYYAPYASRLWCYDKEDKTIGEDFHFTLQDDVNAITLSYDMSGVNSAYPSVYKVIDDVNGKRIRITDFSQDTGGFINVFTGEITVASASPTGRQCLNYYVIPEGAKQVDYPCFKTQKIYGSGFLDADGKWISGYSNATPGVYRHTMDIPVEAHTFVLGYPDTKYASELNVPVFDYLEFISF